MQLREELMELMGDIDGSVLRKMLSIGTSMHHMQTVNASTICSKPLLSYHITWLSIKGLVSLCHLLVDWEIDIFKF